MRGRLDNDGLVELLCLDVNYVFTYSVYWTAADSVVAHVAG